jgi:DNA modification methylase
VTVTLLRGDALHLPIADHTVDLVVTSPPYFSLRSYQDGGQHYPGQIGSEATPAEWVEAMLAATAEMVRVLKPCGSIWVNLGDSYYSGKGAPGRTTVDAKSPARTVRREGGNPLDGPTFGIRQKSLIGLPLRYALACIDQLGLILRAEVNWSKPNGLPESVTDRVRRSHETWFHFTTQPRYFAAVDEIREPQAETWRSTGRVENRGTKWAEVNGGLGLSGNTPRDYNPLGKLPGSVWTIPSQPLTVPPELGVDHFAAFPMAWPRRLIGGWSPAGICTVCKKGRIRHASKAPQRPIPGLHQSDGGLHRLRDDGGSSGLRPPRQGDEALSDLAVSGSPNFAGDRRSDGVRRAVRQVPHVEALERGREGATERVETAAMLLWEAVDGSGDVSEALHPVATSRDASHSARQASALVCSCPSDIPTTPAVVLDGFGGTGTTALVAHVMGRHGISIDLSSDYCRLAAWRTSDRGQLAQAAQVEKPPAQTVGQDTLFEVTG